MARPSIIIEEDTLRWGLEVADEAKEAVRDMDEVVDPWSENDATDRFMVPKRARALLNVFCFDARKARFASRRSCSERRCSSRNDEALAAVENHVVALVGITYYWGLLIHPFNLFRSHSADHATNSPATTPAIRSGTPSHGEETRLKATALAKVIVTATVEASKIDVFVVQKLVGPEREQITRDAVTNG